MLTLGQFGSWFWVFSASAYIMFTARLVASTLRLQKGKFSGSSTSVISQRIYDLGILTSLTNYAFFLECLGCFDVGLNCVLLKIFINPWNEVLRGTVINILHNLSKTIAIRVYRYTGGTHFLPLLLISRKGLTGCLLLFGFDLKLTL